MAEVSPIVTMSSGLGRLLKDTEVSFVDFDMPLLYDTLHELGEPEDAALPIHIILADYRRWGKDHKAHAWLGERARNVRVPLFTARRKADGIFYDYDADITNRSLLHELRHAVDFTDSELLQTHQTAWKKMELVHRSTVWAKALWTAGVEIEAVREAVTAHSAKDMVISLGIGAAGAAASLVYGKVENNRYETAIWRNTPLEDRAYTCTDQWQDEGKIPHIIRVHTQSVSMAD